MRTILLAITLSLVCAFASGVKGAGVERVTVFESGKGAYKVYRIPAAIATAKGTVLAFCEGRQGKGDSGQIHLLVKRSTDGGKTFGKTAVVWEDAKNTCGNPCPVVDQSTGTVWLLMTHNLGEDHEKDITTSSARASRSAWVTSSTDDGVTWSKPRDITSAVKKPTWTWYATGPGVGIQLEQGPHKGRLVIPCDYSVKGEKGSEPAGGSHVIYSDDHGQTWQLGGAAQAEVYNESQCVELPGGKVMLNMRNFRPRSAEKAAATPRQRGVSVSDDGGATFADRPRDATLIEPVCQASILRYAWEPQSMILFSNPASTDKRANMTVRLSTDEASTWSASKVIHEGPSAYSCLVKLPDGRVGLLYECGEKTAIDRIELASFPIEWLTRPK